MSDLENPEARDAETKAAGLVKGETACNRRACQYPLTGRGIRWWNKGSEAWYCESCASRINDAEPALCVREDEWLRAQLAALTKQRDEFKEASGLKAGWLLEARAELAKVTAERDEAKAELEEWNAGNRSLIPSGIQRRETRIRMLKSVLQRLIAAKDEKELNGSTPRYHILKRGAWDAAREAVRE